MTRRELLKAIVGGAAIMIVPTFPALPDAPKVGRVHCLSPLGRKVAHVTCNGVTVEHAYDADDIHGWVKYFAPDSRGMIRHRDGQLLRETVRGDVRFVWKEEA